MTTPSSQTVAAPKPAAKTVKTAAKPVVKPVPKSIKRLRAAPPRPAPKVAAKVATKVSVKATPKVASPKPEKVRKPKLVRDSFTIPKLEYLVVDALKARAAKLAQPVKKSELLRAGLKALAAMPDAALKLALQAVPAIKTGRPKN